jgi:hypothetical protein
MNPAYPHYRSGCLRYLEDFPLYLARRQSTCDKSLLNKELALPVRYAKKRKIDTLSKKLSIFQNEGFSMHNDYTLL